MRYALISVTDKEGVAEFAAGLVQRGFEILSTGNTAKHLEEHGIDVTGVSYYTGFPEILDGRVKTLHPKLHGGLLGIPEKPHHLEEMEQLGIKPIEVLAVNLYPFEQTVLSGASKADAIENIDIGGPAMIRAAAKNAERVFVVVDPKDYSNVLSAIDAEADDFRELLRAKAFAHTAYYDSIIAEYLSEGIANFEIDSLTIGYRLASKLRYGENPHQSGALYVRPFQGKGVVGAKQIWGKELSYNNYLDAEAAWELACDLEVTVPTRQRPIVIVKHGNPCGAAWSVSTAEAFVRARDTDPISAFGGIVAVPGELDDGVAEAMTEKGNFFEVVVCGSIGDEALDRFKSRSGWGQDVRILVAGERPSGGFESIRGLRGGALVQDADVEDPVDWRTVTQARPNTEQESALRAMWTIAKHVKSNAIVVGGADGMYGAGAGQMNRVQSVRLALEQAGDRAMGAVLASDAFFPFPDSIETAAKAGISAIVQPGGSKKDADVISAADALGVAMVFTGVRHFRH